MSEQRPTTTLPAGKKVTLRVAPMPADANQSGDIFGGWIMAQVDIAGSIPAVLTYVAIDDNRQPRAVAPQQG